MSNLLLSPLAVGNLALRNRIVMAPMTRSGRNSRATCRPP